MRFTVCEQSDPPIRSIIEEQYIPWYADVDTSTEWYFCASGLSSFTLPLICVIDPADPDSYLDRTMGIQYAEEFYTRLQSHVSPPDDLPDPPVDPELNDFPLSMVELLLLDNGDTGPGESL